jgi:serine/threonine protein kinase/tetratricopeptide (TPR) repeat protein
MKLSQQEWSSLSRLLDEALSLPAADRAAWLEVLPQTTDRVRATLREILSSEAGAETDTFLKTLPKLNRVVAANRASGRLGDGAIVGPYRLLREVGQGGMGSVWLAERIDGMLKRAVALKLPHSDLPDIQLEERFGRERDILAALSHPHIARLYDAGVTEDGQSYLALEYVDGRPIGTYCDAHRLDVLRRLALYTQVLDAVQYAHARLVVHRDLKPSNILVDAGGQVHLLDFGIAKLLAEGGVDGELTQAAGRLFTLHYASPEQIGGAPLTTATDVYSLGVILYELITGGPPYRLKRESAGALEEAILEAEVMRPSAACKDSAKAALRGTSLPNLQKMLRGDLDTIVLKALKKIPAERYASVTAFADDLRRYLAYEPVSARPDSLTYRTAKFVRRNRLAVALSGLVLVALMVGLAGTITQAERATRAAAIAGDERNRADEQARAATEQRDFALRELSRASAVNDLNQFLLSDAAPSGKPFTAGELLSRAEAIIQRQHAESDANRAEMLVAIGRQYGTMDQDDRARQILGQAYDLARALPDHTTLARAACPLAAAVNRTGDHERAEALLREAMANLPDEPQFVLDRISCLLEGNVVAREGNDFALGLQRATEAQALLPKLNDRSALLEMRVAIDLAESYRQLGRFPAAVEMFERAYSRLIALGRENTETAGTIYNNWGLTLFMMGQPRKAEEFLRRAVQVSSADGTDKHVSPMVLTNLSRTLLALERNAEAARNADRAYERARTAGDDVVVTQSLILRAVAYRKLGDYARAERLLAEAEPRLRRMGGILGLASLASEHSLLAEARGDSMAALAEMNEAVALADKSKNPDALRYFLLLRAELEIELERIGPALDDSRKTIQLYLDSSERGALSGNLGRAYLVEARALAASGRGDEAERALHSALEQLRPTLGPDHPRTKVAERLASATHATLAR